MALTGTKDDRYPNQLFAPSQFLVFGEMCTRIQTSHFGGKIYRHAILDESGNICIVVSLWVADCRILNPIHLAWFVPVVRSTRERLL